MRTVQPVLIAEDWGGKMRRSVFSGVNVPVQRGAPMVQSPFGELPRPVFGAWMIANSTLSAIGEELADAGVPAARSEWMPQDYEMERSALRNQVKALAAEIAAKKEQLMALKQQLGGPAAAQGRKPARRAPPQQQSLSPDDDAYWDSMEPDLPDVQMPDFGRPVFDGRGGVHTKIAGMPGVSIVTPPGTQAAVVAFGNGVSLVADLPAQTSAFAGPDEIGEAVTRAAFKGLQSHPAQKLEHWSSEIGGCMCTKKKDKR